MDSLFCRSTRITSRPAPTTAVVGETNATLRAATFPRSIFFGEPSGRRQVHNVLVGVRSSSDRFPLATTARWNPSEEIATEVNGCVGPASVDLSAPSGRLHERTLRSSSAVIRDWLSAEKARA